MTHQEVIQKTAEYVKETLSGEGSGHDWWHIQRVWNNAKEIMKGEEVDAFVVELAALLHDIADHKFHGGDHSVGPRIAGEWLEGLRADEAIIERVKEIIDTISFTKQVKGTSTNSLEAQVVQDADRLDALGAIGIARAFATGAKFNEIFHDPEMNAGEYNPNTATREKAHTVINHFHEKLLLIKDLMNTQTAKKIAQHRHEYMEAFLEEFMAEWDGKR